VVVSARGHRSGGRSGATLSRPPLRVSIPLQLNFVPGLNLVGGGLGVTSLRGKCYTQEA